MRKSFLNRRNGQDDVAVQQNRLYARLYRCLGLPSLLVATVGTYLFSSTDEMLNLSLSAFSGRAPKPRYRQISIDLGNGNCQWTDAEPLGPEADPYGTLFASYPASGMRITWQQTEGITGIQVGDDFHLGGTNAYDKTGLLKTQYPHLEGIWTYRDNMDQVVLVVRNPRWAIPSYHTLLAELNYAHDWRTAYEYLYDTFTTRPPLEDWRRWRDYRFEDEIMLWKWGIEFYMENGTQYWSDLDFERNGQFPFRFLTDEEKAANDAAGLKDRHCRYDVDCVPKTIVSYEKLKDVATGPEEITKVANVLRGKRDMTVVDESAIACVYAETWLNHNMPNNDNRDDNGAIQAGFYNFTWEQMLVLNDTLYEMKTKYTTGDWENSAIAAELVDNLDLYINETANEIQFYIENEYGGPTLAPDANYTQQLVQWYQTLGRGDRYNKTEIQRLAQYWPLVRCLYNESEPCEPLTNTSIVYDDPVVNQDFGR